MYTIQKYLRQCLTTLGIALAIGIAGSTAALALEPARGAKPEMKQEWTEHRAEWIKEKLDQAANRLEIKASQQNAWQAYAKAVEGFANPDMEKFPGADADAATVTRFAADKAAEMARKLRTVADATTKLQAVLDAEQRKTLDQIVHEAHEHMMMMHHHFGGEHEGHEGMEHGGWGHHHEHGEDGMCEHDGPADGQGAPPPPPPAQQ